MKVEQRQAAADPQTKPRDSGCESACIGSYRIHHHRHLLLLLSPKADTNSPSHKPQLTKTYFDEPVFLVLTLKFLSYKFTSLGQTECLQKKEVDLGTARL